MSNNKPSLEGRKNTSLKEHSKNSQNAENGYLDAGSHEKFKRRG